MKPSQYKPTPNYCYNILLISFIQFQSIELEWIELKEREKKDITAAQSIKPIQSPIQLKTFN